MFPNEIRTNSLLRILSLHSIHLIFLLVVLPKQEPEDPPGNKRRNTDASVHPDQLGIDADTGESSSEGRSKRRGEQEHGHDEGFHGGRGFGVCVFETGDGGEDFREGDEDVGGDLSADIDGAVGIACSEIVTWRRRIDQVLKRSVNDRQRVKYLNASSISHCSSSKHESKKDTRDRTEMNANLAESGVYEQIHNGDKDDESNRIDVLQEIVWNAMSFHLSGLRDQIVEHLIVTNPIDREKHENATCDQRTTNFVHKQIVPMRLVFMSDISLERRFRRIEIALVAQSNPKDLERVQHNRSTRRSSNVLFATRDKNKDGEEEHAKGKEVSGPKVDACFKLSGCQAGQTANVDGPVEPGVHALDSDGGVDDDAFARFEDFDVSAGVCVLFDDEGGDIGFDASGADTNDNHGDDEAGGVGCGAGRGNGCGDEDELTDGVDECKDNDGLVTAEILICDNCTEDGSDIAPRQVRKLHEM